MRTRFLCFLLMGLFSITWQGSAFAREKVRAPVVAGMFYPSDADELRRVIHGYMGKVEQEPIEGRIVALISPHAGYIYSGQVAAYAYKLVEGMDFDHVVVMAPCHGYGFSGASIYDGEGYGTPLGIVPVDAEISRRIGNESKIIRYIPQAHTQEHSLEVQIPFAQAVLKRFSLVPMVMGPTWSFSICQELSAAIVRSLRGKRALIIASSDLTHSHDYRRVVAQDELLARHIDRFDINSLSEDLKKGRCQACGGGPIVVAMMAAQGLGANRGKVLKLTNSGEVTGEKGFGNYVVGYLAAVLYQAAEREVGNPSSGSPSGELRLMEGGASP